MGIITVVRQSESVHVCMNKMKLLSLHDLHVFAVFLSVSLQCISLQTMLLLIFFKSNFLVINIRFLQRVIGPDIQE